MSVTLLRGGTPPTQPPKSVNAGAIELLRDALTLAEAGEVTSIALCYTGPSVDVTYSYDVDGGEADLACAAQQVAEELRQIVLDL